VRGAARIDSPVGVSHLDDSALKFLDGGDCVLTNFALRLNRGKRRLPMSIQKPLNQSHFGLARIENPSSHGSRDLRHVQNLQSDKTIAPTMFVGQSNRNSSLFLFPLHDD
jgi:hypothetical protein